MRESNATTAKRTLAHVDAQGTIEVPFLKSNALRVACVSLTL